MLDVNIVLNSSNREYVSDNYSIPTKWTLKLISETFILKDLIQNDMKLIRHCVSVTCTGMLSCYYRYLLISLYRFKVLNDQCVKY